MQSGGGRRLFFMLTDIFQAQYLTEARFSGADVS